MAQSRAGSYKTAWHLGHRIRMATSEGTKAAKLKGDVQIDETYVGANRRSKNADGTPRKRGRGTTKVPVVALVETGGSVRSMPMEHVTSANLRAAMQAHVDPSARIVTDDYNAYDKPASEFAGGHYTVKHKEGEYTTSGGLTTNTVEAYFALLRRHRVHFTMYQSNTCTDIATSSLSGGNVVSWKTPSAATRRLSGPKGNDCYSIKPSGKREGVKGAASHLAVRGKRRKKPRRTHLPILPPLTFPTWRQMTFSDWINGRDNQS